MEQTTSQKSGFRSFPRNFWTVITMEFFERGSYYGVMSVLSVYLVLSTKNGGLGFSKESVGVIKSTITPILYFLPILAGSLADKIGYKKVLMFAFIVMSIGYTLTGLATSYGYVFGSLIIMVIGAGCFKPLISGTIARSTDESNSTLGFGIFYWAINLGAFIFPLILIPILKEISWSYIFFMAAIGTGWLLILNIFLYKEPIIKNKIKESKLAKSISDIFEILYSPLILLLDKCLKLIAWRIIAISLTILFITTSYFLLALYGSTIMLIVELIVGLLFTTTVLREFNSKKRTLLLFLVFFVLTGLILYFIISSLLITIILTIVLFVFSMPIIFLIDLTDKTKYIDHFKFVLMIVIYSGFWILYFQMFDTVLWYLSEYMNMTPVNNFVNSFLRLFMDNPQWKFEAEHVTVINAGTIILLQILVSSIVKHTKALPTMIVGITMGTIGMAILAISPNAWIFIAGMIIFSIGEMTAHPKFISYVGLIAPPDKKALYLGYSFLYGVIGSGIGGVLGANLYVYFVDTLKNPSALWFIFSLIGVVTIIGLLLFNKFLAPKKV
jgi:dipeptide/tripeptide permease